MPVDQQKIEDRIVIAVKKAKRTGATLAVNVESTNILAKHPDSPFSKEEIEAKLGSNGAERKRTFANRLANDAGTLSIVPLAQTALLVRGGEGRHGLAFSRSKLP